MRRLDQVQASRLKKLTAIQKAGIDPYPAKAQRTDLIAKIKKDWDKYSGQKVFLAGRLKALRGHGRTAFADLADESGQIQLLLRADKLDAEFKKWAWLDIGDFIEASGVLGKSKTGEPTLEITSFRILAKTLKPLPDQHHGLTNQESRLRQRYLDLLINPGRQDLFRKRSQLAFNLRKFYRQEGYLEVETPILQSQAGGAIAEPFVTRHRRLGTDLYLRVAAELYLKRLLVGGFEKIFELGPVFRNEGISPDHLQEFYMLESYTAYDDYCDGMKFTEKMLPAVLKETFGHGQFTYQKKKIDFIPPWPVLDYRELLIKDCGLDIDQYSEKKELATAIKKKKIKLDLPHHYSWGKLVDELYKTVSRPKISGPAFLTNHPLALSPLAKKQEKTASKVQRYQLLVAGFELVNGFSELNDPLDQEERFHAQAKERAAGDREAHPLDKDYVEALKYGMPPAAGLGLGLDRLLALACDLPNLRETVLFPPLRSTDRE